MSTKIKHSGNADFLVASAIRVAEQFMPPPEKRSRFDWESMILGSNLREYAADFGVENVVPAVWRFGIKVRARVGDLSRHERGF